MHDLLDIELVLLFTTQDLNLYLGIYLLDTHLFKILLQLVEVFLGGVGEQNPSKEVQKIDNSVGVGEEGVFREQPSRNTVGLLADSSPKVFGICTVAGKN